ncbi:MAG: hypothetical protein ACLTQN_07770 [Blautia massiliensis (ex Durand et al. 2017)]
MKRLRQNSVNGWIWDCNKSLRRFRNLTNRWTIFRADIDRLQRKQKEMQTTGRAYVDPTSTDAYKSTAEKYNVESQKLEHINGRLYSSYNKLKNKVEEYRQKNSRLVQVMQNLQKAAARVGMVVKNMGSALRSAGSAIKSMVSAMKKAVENMFNLNKQTDRSRMSLFPDAGNVVVVFRGIPGDKRCQ